MMGTQTEPAQLFYEFCLEDHLPDDHLLRRIDPFLDLDEIGASLQSHYSPLGRPSVDPELMIRWCQSNANQSPNLQMMRISRRQLTPFGQRGGAIFGTDTLTAD